MSRSFLVAIDKRLHPREGLLETWRERVLAAMAIAMLLAFVASFIADFC